MKILKWLISVIFMKKPIERKDINMVILEIIKNVKEEDAEKAVVEILKTIEEKEMEPSREILEFIKEFESLHDGDLSKIGLQPKLDPIGIWTEGWGSVMRDSKGKMMKVDKYPTLESVLPFARIHTIEEADADLEKTAKEKGKGVLKRLKVEVSQNQFDALVSHAYNCGFSSTMYKLVNERASESEIKNWFTTKYVTAGGVYLRGLQFRRNDEFEVWKGLNYKREYKISI